MPNQQQIYARAVRKWLAAILLEHLNEVHHIQENENYNPELARSEALSLAHELTRGNGSERHLHFAIDQAAIELEIEKKQNRLRRAIHFDDKKNNFRRNV